MKLASFTTGKNMEIGVVRDDEIVSISRAAPSLAQSMIDLIGNWPALQREVRRMAEGPGMPLSAVRLLAPIQRPGKILAIGMNYADHVAEMGRQMPTKQVWFCKHVTAVNNPFDAIQIPKVSSMVDYEAEMVVVIGQGGRHITRRGAPGAIFGYCVGNDVSVRDWQNATPQWMLGKSFDTHAPFGPWITTADEIDNPHALGIRCFVNGAKRQDSNTGNLIFNIWDQISHLSQAMTLEPGDLIFTGTPGGVGMGMTPPQFLRPGETVRPEIDRLGMIEARCAAEE